MKLRAILLALMILFDVSLHWARLLGIEHLHPLFPNFPLWIISYELFWTIFWTVGFIIMITLLGGGVTVKNKTIINNYIQKPERLERTEGIGERARKNIKEMGEALR